MPTTLDLPNNDFNDFPNLYDVHNASHNKIQFYPTKATFLGTPDLNESLIIIIIIIIMTLMIKRVFLQYWKNDA